ncbi:MAG: hypothetical protein N3A71_02260 [Candidatus Dojkabacteria bacterium]|nr:hypothetical protein [Candidatus Dojkabacteria bacterium]
MKIKFNSKKILNIIVFVLMLLFLFGHVISDRPGSLGSRQTAPWLTIGSGKVLAQSEFVGSKRGLIMSPIVIYLNGERGTTLKNEHTYYKLTNDYETKASVVVYPSVVNIIRDEEGNVKIDETEKDRKSDVASWVVLESTQHEIKHGETIRSEFSINIPDDADPGSHLFAILFARSPADTNTNSPAVGINDKILLPVILTIDGDINFESDIDSFFVSDLLLKEQSFFWGGTAVVNVKIKNNSNIYVRPLGNIFIHQGDKTKPVETLAFNENGLIISSNNSRNYRHSFSTNNFIKDKIVDGKIVWEFDWSRFFDFKFGKYYVTYQSRIKPAPEAGLPNDKVIIIERTTEIFVFPIQILILIIVIVLLIVALVAWNYFKKSKKRENK